MSGPSSLIGAVVSLVFLLTCVRGTEAGGNPADVNVLSVKAFGGVIVRYPHNWKAAVTREGTVVALAGPTRGSFRPAATFLVARGKGDVGEMLGSAGSGLGKQRSITLLGEQHLSPSRWARYYVRGEGATAEYVVVGVAEGNGWIVTMVGVDSALDPLLRVHAEVLQELLVGVVLPAS